MKLFTLAVSALVAFARDFSGEYIVVMKQGTEAAEDFVAKYSPETSYKIGTTFNAHFLKNVDEALLAEVAMHPAVDYAAPNGEITIAGVQRNAPSWGLGRTSTRAGPGSTPPSPVDTDYYYNNIAGRGVDVYIIDTGIYTEHNDFGGRATWGYTAPGVDGGDNDCNGHGTHCASTSAGTAYGIAKEASLIAVKVLGCSGSGSYDGIISGFQWIDQMRSRTRPSVVNLSLGGGRSTAVNQALDALVYGGVSAAVSAGNDYYSDSCNSSPASADMAFTVMSSTNQDRPSSFSNIGDCSQIWAPGSSITAAWIGSKTATNTISGTSMAAPHVAGVMALLAAEAPSTTPLNMYEQLTNLATRNQLTYPSSSSIWSRTPNLLLYNDGESFKKEKKPLLAVAQ